MDIPIDVLQYSFKTKPLVVGGKAKEYYGIRASGKDTDLIVTAEDYALLAQQYPEDIKDLWGDVGVCVHGFEIWKTICLFDYEFYSYGAIEQSKYNIISLEKLLFMTALAADKKIKYKQDLDLIVKKIYADKYKNFDDSKYRDLKKEP